MFKMQHLPCAAALLVICMCDVIEGLVKPLDGLPADLEKLFDMYHKIGNLHEQSGEPVFWNALQEYMCKFSQNSYELTNGEYQFLRENVYSLMQPLYHEQFGRRTKRQASPVRIRREIRMLSRSERQAYFNAVNALKTDTRLLPNVYDALMRLHSGGNILRAHFGPAFPAWHRIYLWMFENFLRFHNSAVTIPYWASVLDNEMLDPTQSVIWSPAFFGNGFGQPVTEPFNQWRSLNPATVFDRNIGNGQLYSYEGIEAILNKTRNAQILLPTPEADSNFEQQHAGPHIFVGGSMNQLDNAVRDPIFYSHHAFVDQIWERFRLHQRVNGIDPATDYPYDANDPRFSPLHAPNATMGFFPINQLDRDYRNIEGYSNIFFNRVQYEPVPTCPSCGGSPYLYCNARGRCASRSISEMGGTGLEPIVSRRTKRQASHSFSTCPKPNFINDYDNKYLWKSGSLQTKTDLSSDWVYVPVKIISKRADQYKSFMQYALDDTQGGNIKKSSQYLSEHCKRNMEDVGKIKIVSYGLNYHGYAEEYAVVDNRIGLVVTNSFVAIKRPGPDDSEAIVAAFDKHGRVCKPYCRRTDSSNEGFAGAVRVTRDLPLHFGNSYTEATLNSWNIPSDDACPLLESNNVPLTFYCDFSEEWVWTSESLNKSNVPSSIVSLLGSMSHISDTNKKPSGDSSLHSFVPAILKYIS